MSDREFVSHDLLPGGFKTEQLPIERTCCVTTRRNGRFLPLSMRAGWVRIMEELGGRKATEIQET